MSAGVAPRGTSEGIQTCFKTHGIQYQIKVITQVLACGVINYAIKSLNIFFFKFLEDISPLHGETGTRILDLW